MNVMEPVSRGLRALWSRGGGPIHRLVASRTWTMLFIFVLATTGSLIYVWQRVVVLDLVDEVAKLEVTSREYRDLLLKSEAEVAELSRIGRITAYAADSLGLAPVALDNLYTVTLPESVAGEGGIHQLWASMKRPFESLPRIESSEASAQELFESPR